MLQFRACSNISQSTHANLTNNQRLINNTPFNKHRWSLWAELIPSIWSVGGILNRLIRRRITKLRGQIEGCLSIPFGNYKFELLRHQQCQVKMPTQSMFVAVARPSGRSRVQSPLVASLDQKSGSAPFMAWFQVRQEEDVQRRELTRPNTLNAYHITQPMIEITKFSKCLKLRIQGSGKSAHTIPPA